MYYEFERDGSVPSQRSIMKGIYDEINRVASPGDIVFFISGRPKRNILTGPAKQMYRKWQGFDGSDTTVWHTAIYVGAKKESGSSQRRSHIIHAIARGVEKTHLSPSYFKDTHTEPGEIDQRGRIEIVQPDITASQRQQIVDYAASQLGKPFADLGWKHDGLTWAFGLPAGKLDPGRVSCHGIAYKAYELIGFSFPHQMDHVPVFNLARYLGHPLGHPADKVNLERLYLRDHHLYRDPRFRSVLSVFQNSLTGQLLTVENPGKYSWNPSLQRIYGITQG